MINFVRTRSNGANMRPVATAAATATPRDAQGYGASKSSAEIPRPVEPGSGTFSSADNKLLDHPSIVCVKRLYTNVVFEPFHTPQTPSFVHSWEMTSSTEFDLRRISFCAEFGEGLGGVVYPFWSLSCRRLDLGGEYECEDGAVEVKYAGSSGSESSERCCFE